MGDSIVNKMASADHFLTTLAQAGGPIDRLAAFLARLHPVWRDRRWEEIGEDTRELFREDARRAIAIYEGQDGHAH